MQSRAEWVRAICQAPEDDGLRLIFADWLEENGEELWAEFIRLSIEYYHGRLESGRTARLPAIEKQLLSRLISSLPQANGVVWHKVVDRGFISHVEFMNPFAFSTMADEVFQASPVRHLSLSRWLGRNRELFLSSNAWCRVKELDLMYSRLGNTGTEMLCREPRFQVLTLLNLSANGIGDQGVIWLTTSPHLRNLRVLVLSQNEIGELGGIALARSSQLVSLERLYINGNRIPGAVIEQIRARYRRVFSEL